MKSELLHETLEKIHPSLSRGIVWCTTCGKSHKINAGQAIKTGWLECCGHTMTIDSPEERRKMKNPPVFQNIAERLRRNCIWQRAKGTRHDTGYPYHKHVPDCDICQGADHLEKMYELIRPMYFSD